MKLDHFVNVLHLNLHFATPAFDLRILIPGAGFSNLVARVNGSSIDWPILYHGRQNYRVDS